VAVPTWHDVLPTVVIEAFAAGRPVLGTAMGGIPYLVGPNGGWVVGPSADAVSAALPVARAEAAGKAAAARARYVDTFHHGVVTKQLIDVYANSYAAHR
jgi:glycosyltransferase involved in cell wall biosynthesis